jgi:hypothetical protein
LNLSYTTTFLILSTHWTLVNVVSLNRNLPLSVYYLDFVNPLVCSQRQDDDICFDVSCAYDLVPSALVRRKLADYGLSPGYVNCFHSYQINRLSCVHYSGALSQA